MLRDLFVLHPNRVTALFTAPQSISTFTVSTCIIVTVSRAARTLARVDAESTLVTLAIACFVSLAILKVTLSDRELRPKSPALWTRSLLVAAVNCLLLYAAAVGVEKF